MAMMQTNRPHYPTPKHARKLKFLAQKQKMEEKLGFPEKQKKLDEKQIIMTNTQNVSPVLSPRPDLADAISDCWR